MGLVRDCVLVFLCAVVLSHAFLCEFSKPKPEVTTLCVDGYLYLKYGEQISKMLMWDNVLHRTRPGVCEERAIALAAE